LSFRNHPLQYWVDYVRHHAAAGSPILILQTKCDTLADDVVNAPFDRTSLNAFACPPQELRTSARTGRGHLALFEALQQAVAWLRDPMRMGLPKIGAGRLRVQRRLEALREADSARPPQAREHRLLTQDLFRAICDEEGGINSRKALLAYLHNAGTVFYWPGLFGDRIVLDQAWALDGVYTVFQRTACHRELRRLHGRFTRPLLALLAWQDRHKSEQDLFLAMMQACGITFVHDIGLAQEPEYVAPDLLPDRTAVASDLAVWWPADQPVESATFAYGFLHDGLIRAIIARIGSEARINGLYWKGGLCLYETTTQSRGLIEQEMTGRWEGLIHVQTQGGQAETLLNRLCRLVEQEQERTGLEFAEAYRQPLHAAREEERPMSYGQPPVEEPEWYVSYAWGDQTDAGKERTRVVDELCARAEARGIRVLRDKNEVQVGDSIGRFMRRLGKGDRVFVILSEKYLRSPSCMFELFEIWRTSQAEGEAFLERVRIFALPDTRFDRPIDRVRHAAHWNAQKTELQQAIEEHGPAVLGERDFADYKLMLDFAHNVSDILAVMADIRRPRTLDELERYGFDDPPPASGT
jgi:internalin A